MVDRVLHIERGRATTAANARCVDVYGALSRTARFWELLDPCRRACDTQTIRKYSKFSSSQCESFLFHFNNRLIKILVIAFKRTFQLVLSNSDLFKR